MELFVKRFADRISGIIAGQDRMLFRERCARLVRSGDWKCSCASHRIRKRSLQHWLRRPPRNSAAMPRLVCELGCVEPCQTFRVRGNRAEWTGSSA